MWYQEALDAARSKPIVEVAEMLGLGEPILRGNEFAVLCPLRPDSNPSLMLSPEKNAWYCFVCGTGGDGIAFYQQATGLSFMDVG